MRHLLAALLLVVGCGQVSTPPGGANLNTVGAPYLSLSAATGLSAERVFTPSARFSATDNGANSTYALDLATTITQGSATNANITWDAYGRLTAATSGSAGGNDDWESYWIGQCDTAAAFTANKYAFFHERFHSVARMWAAGPAASAGTIVLTSAGVGGILAATSTTQTYLGTSPGTDAGSDHFMATNGKWCLVARIKVITPSSFPLAGTERGEVALHTTHNSTAVSMGILKTASTTKWVMHDNAGTATLSAKNIRSDEFVNLMAYSDGTNLFFRVTDSASTETAVTGPLSSAQGSTPVSMSIYVANTTTLHFDDVLLVYPSP